MSQKIVITAYNLDEEGEPVTEHEVMEVMNALDLDNIHVEITTKE